MISTNRRLRAVLFIGLVGVWLVSIAATQSIGAQNDRAEEWNVAVDAKQDRGREWYLNIVAKYRGDKAIEIPLSDIPWEWGYAAKIAAVETGTLGEQLKQEFPVSDPPYGYRSISPGQVLSGTFLLSRRFPTLAKEVERRGVIVFWTFKLGDSKRVGGWLEIPQKAKEGEKGISPIIDE